MVSVIDQYHQIGADRHKGMIVELVGVAGTGKSTLFKKLQIENDPQISCVYHPEVWRFSSFPFYIANIFLLLPVLFKLLWTGERYVTRREIAFLAILNGWNTYLLNLVRKTNKIYIVDQGPISLMCFLNIWGPKNIIKNLPNWWKKIYLQWSNAINLVILLDASDETLATRINSRVQDHHLKGEPELLVRDWIARYRNIYNEILSRLTLLNSNLRIIRINSAELSPDEIVEKILPIIFQN